MMYQPKIKDHLIRKLFFAAKRAGKKMTHLINEILEEYLVTEPDPPPYEPAWMRYQPSPDYAKRKERMLKKLMREYHGEMNGSQAQEREAETRGEADVQALAESTSDRQDPV
jgi:hypothetical protein